MASKTANQKVKTDFEKLKLQFPRIFDEIKPFEWGVVDDMIANCTELSPDEIKKAVRYYMHTTKFLKAVIRRKWFRDINSSRTRLISQEEKQKAHKELSRILEVQHKKYSQERAETRFAQALAKQTGINFDEARLVEPKSSVSTKKDKVLVVIKKPNFKYEKPT